jgi:hypothetical protein
MFQDQSPDAPAPAAQTGVTRLTGVVIRPMDPADASQVLAVYQAGLDTGLALPARSHLCSFFIDSILTELS